MRADAFCHNMVRSLVGALLFVGDGHRPADVARRRCWPRGCGTPAVHVVRPHGLTLEEVGYPADELLAARNRQARNDADAAGARAAADRCAAADQCLLSTAVPLLELDVCW